MVKLGFSTIIALAGLAIALASFAQPRAPDPADPAAPSPRLGYASAFDGYRTRSDVGPGDWRAVNDRVREAAAKAPAPASPQPGVPTREPMPMPRVGGKP